MSKLYCVPSVDRALRILELIAESKRGFSLSEIARRLRLPKSSVHLLITTLETTGYLQKNRLDGKYLFGLKLVSLSRTSLENLDFREEARPFVQDLMLRTGLTVHVAILERNEAVIIDKIEAPGMLRLATWIGRRLDINCSGVGKALMAFLPGPEIDRQLSGTPLSKHNNKTIVSPSKLKLELKKVRELGYAFDDEEDELGFRCIGAPIFDFMGKPFAAISVAGTTAQIPRERCQKLASVLKATADEISTHFGYPGG